MIQQKNKNQKPIEHDIHLKYLCPKCGEPHWLSFKEASTKNYKIVCDCDHIFKVKRVAGFKLKYVSNKVSKQEVSKPVEKLQPIIPSELLKSITKALTDLGFTNSEAKNLATKTYIDFPVDDIGLLVKRILESMKNVK